MFQVIGVMVVFVGCSAAFVFTWINLAASVDVDKRVVKLDTQRYELEKRICELEEWRNS